MPNALACSHPAPLRVTVNFGSQQSDKPYGPRLSETLDVDAAGVRASHDTYDPLWDGPTAEPDHPGDWSSVIAASKTSPALSQAIDGLQEAAAHIDWRHAPTKETADRAYATVHVTYPDRPDGAAQAWQQKDGSWTAYARTSIDTGSVDPALAPIIAAAHTTIAAAAPASAATRSH